jgi:hypothetical protein
MSQPLLASFNYFGNFSILARSRALTLRITPCEWLAPNTTDLLAHRSGTNPSTLAIETLPLINIQILDVDFHL